MVEIKNIYINPDFERRNEKMECAEFEAKREND